MDNLTNINPLEQLKQQLLAQNNFPDNKTTANDDSSSSALNGINISDFLSSTASILRGFL